MKKLYLECDLIAQLVKQDRQAFNYLYDNYSAALYGVVFKIVKNEEIAQDLLQDTFVKIWKNCEQHDPEKGRFFTWMMHIARNICFDYLRTNRPETVDLIAVGDILENNQIIFPNIENNELEELISQLKKEQKVLIEMVYWEGYSHQETANRLKLPLGTVKTRVRDALKKLRFISGTAHSQPVPGVG